jgi:hypothetical protein
VEGAGSAPIADLDLQWHRRLEQLERAARPARRAKAEAKLPPGALRFDQQDHLHAGWWHGP